MNDKNRALDFLSKQVISSETEVWEYIDHLKEEYPKDYKLFEQYYKKNKRGNIRKNHMENLNENNTIELLQKIIMYDDTKDYESNFILKKIQLVENEFLDVCAYYEIPEGENCAYLLLVSIENILEVNYLCENRSLIILSIAEEILQYENVDNFMFNEFLYMPGNYDRNKNVSPKEYNADQERRKEEISEMERLLEDEDEMEGLSEEIALEEQKRIEQKDMEERKRKAEEKAKELIAQEELEKKLEKTVSKSSPKSTREKKKAKSRQKLKKEPSKSEPSKSEPSKSEPSKSEPSEPELSEPEPSEPEHLETELSNVLDSTIRSPSVDEKEEKEFWKEYMQKQDDERLAEILSRSPDPLETKTTDPQSEDVDYTFKVDDLLETVDTPDESPTKHEENEEKITALLRHLKKKQSKKSPKKSFSPDYDENKETLKKLEYLIKQDNNVVDVPIAYGGQTFYFKVVKDSYIHKKLTNIPSKYLIPDIVSELYELSPKDYKTLSVFPKDFKMRDSTSNI